MEGRLESLVNGYREQLGIPERTRPGELPLDEADAVLVACADSFRSGDGPPLECLLRFLDQEAEGVVAGVNLRDVSPGDDRQLDPALGEWEHIEALSDEFSLMVDLDLRRTDAVSGDPGALLELVRRFLAFVTNGARIIRLEPPEPDAGGDARHVHAAVKLLRAVSDDVAPWVVLVADTHSGDEGGLEYFGDGTDEAHLVSAPALAALTLDAFVRGDGTSLRAWAETRAPRSSVASFYNYLDSHDGMALGPARSMMGGDRVSSLVAVAEERGGHAGYRQTSAGEIADRLHVSVLNAVVNTALPDAQRAEVCLAAHSIMLSLAGVPGIYYHGLIGSEDPHGSLDLDALSAELNEEGSLRNHVFDGYKELLRARASSPAFAPCASQTVIEAPKEVFALLREAAGEDERVLCLVNLAEREAQFTCSADALALGEERGFREIISGDYVYPTHEAGSRISLELQPYEVMWLRYGR